MSAIQKIIIILYWTKYFIYVPTYSRDFFKKSEFIESLFPYPSIKEISFKLIRAY